MTARAERGMTDAMMLPTWRRIEKALKDSLAGYGGFDGCILVVMQFLHIQIPKKEDSRIFGEAVRMKLAISDANSLVRFCDKRALKKKSYKQIERGVQGFMKTTLGLEETMKEAGEEYDDDNPPDPFYLTQCQMEEMGLEIVPYDNAAAIGFFRAYQLYSILLKNFYRAFVKIIQYYEYATQREFVITDGPTQEFFMDTAYGNYAGETVSVTEGEKTAISNLALCIHNKVPEKEAFRLFDLMALAESFGAMSEGVSFKSSVCDEEVGAAYQKYLSEYLEFAGPLQGRNYQRFTENADIHPSVRPRPKEWHIGQPLLTYYAPYFIDRQGYWNITGKLMGETNLVPEESPPLEGSHMTAALTVMFGAAGLGKTLLFKCVDSWLLDQKHYIIFSPAGDSKNQNKYAMMPLLPLDERTGMMCRWMDDHGIRRHGVPTLILDFVLNDDDYSRLKDQVITKYDRIIKIEDPYRFKLPFAKIVAELREIARNDYGGYEGGYIFVRNLKRSEWEDQSVGGAKKSQADVEIGRTCLDQFMEYRRTTFNTMSRESRPKMQLEIDEIWSFAPATTQYGGRDVSQFAGDFLASLIDCRQYETSVLVATQEPAEVVKKARTSATAMFFRALSPDNLDAVIENLPLKSPRQGVVIKDMIVGGQISKDDGNYLWPLYLGFGAGAFHHQALLPRPRNRHRGEGD